MASRGHEQRSYWAAVHLWAGTFKRISTIRQAAPRSNACLDVLLQTMFSWLVVSYMAASLALLENGSKWAWSNNLNELPRILGRRLSSTLLQYTSAGSLKELCMP